MKQLLDRIKDLITIDPTTTLTIEQEHGQTYSHDNPALYAHNEYEEGSVLEGQPRRIFLDAFDTWEDARKAATTIREGLPNVQLDILDDGETTHIDVERVLDAAGLEKDDEYIPEYRKAGAYDEGEYRMSAGFAGEMAAARNAHYEPAEPDEYQEDRDMDEPEDEQEDC